MSTIKATGDVAFLTCLFMFTLFLSMAFSQEESGTKSKQNRSGQKQISAMDTTSLEEISRRLDNPLSSFWSLVFQENLKRQTGEALEEDQFSNTFFFQPALPVPFGREYLFFARPVFPLITSPVQTAEGGSDGHETGFGDIQIMMALGPNRIDGVVWGAGPTFVFPTATADILGGGKYQAGPAFMYFYLGRPWTLGILAQHWWSFAGDEHRDDISRTDIQYVARRQFPGAWSIGMGPTITIDWLAEKKNRLSFPIGLGITKTVRIGGTPIKMRIEPQYSIVKPEDYGTEWNLRIQIAPVIRSPFI